MMSMEYGSAHDLRQQVNFLEAVRVARWRLMRDQDVGLLARKRLICTRKYRAAMLEQLAYARLVKHGAIPLAAFRRHRL